MAMRRKGEEELRWGWVRYRRHNPSSAVSFRDWLKTVIIDPSEFVEDLFWESASIPDIRLFPENWVDIGASDIELDAGIISMADQSLTNPPNRLPQ
jgi:hypothetical protein